MVKYIEDLQREWGIFGYVNHYKLKKEKILV